ncbi:MAG: glycosyltransferase family 39 protein [Candidatus Binataceae bacterium]|jgi:hypothetical protein
MDNPAKEFSHPRVAAEARAWKWMGEPANAAACCLVLGWYLAAYLIVRPIADGPVVDSWIYAHAVAAFMRTGRIRFAGYAQATPALLVVYGAAWARAFGASAVSLDLSVALLGAIGAMLFYALARRCGAAGWPAVAATAMLIANPCYTFMSFSFMTEIPFITLLIGAHLAFARARAAESRWLWLSALIAFLAFMVRPFAAAAIAGSAVAVLVGERAKLTRESTRRIVVALAPFAGGLAMCALGWIWLTRFNPQPWMLHQSEQRLHQFFQVSLATYVRAGLIGPLLYLGVVLSPIALPRLMTASSWRKGVAIGAGLFVVAALLTRLVPGLPATPELSCFGGWRNALLIHGLPTRFAWHSGWAQWPAMALGAFGAAGIVMAAASIPATIRRGAIAVIATTIIYWIGVIPLWLFNDRYYLVMVPAGCLILALTPPRGISRWAVAIGGIVIMGAISIAGVDDYQRVLETLIVQRDALESIGIPRGEIDAGYSLNGGDLYYQSEQAIEHEEMAPEIPMVASSRKLVRFTIAGAPVSGTRIVRRIDWPGPLSCGGSRQIYLLERVATAKN